MILPSISFAAGMPLQTFPTGDMQFVYCHLLCSLRTERHRWTLFRGAATRVPSLVERPSRRIPSAIGEVVAAWVLRKRQIPKND
jgi:hypothetical protein